MTKSRSFQIAVLLVIVAFSLTGQQALAQHHLQARIAPGARMGSVNAPAVTSLLFQLSSGFGVLPPLDSGGADFWPCFTGGANADCSSIPAGGVVIGGPGYTQSLAACDANSASATNCGQVFWFYEDDTGDNTDHLIVSIAVKQGTKFILDTGNFDFGANPFPAGSVIIISDDTAFGTLGATGKNNGFCAGSNKICSDPVAGIATVTVTTKVGTSKITSKFNINLQ